MLVKLHALDLFPEINFHYTFTEYPHQKFITGHRMKMRFTVSLILQIRNSTQAKSFIKCEANGVGMNKALSETHCFDRILCGHFQM